MFLASSLNVELVYSILKGITQFGYVTLCEPEIVRDKLSELNTEPTEDGMRLTLTKIKIKDSKKWQDASYKEFLQDSRVTIKMAPSGKHDILVLDHRVTVTFHMLEHFRRLYRLWGINDYTSFSVSLSPKFNRDMIFKAGEGAGRSGSFFFFSHDQKFVVKTMTSTELALMKRLTP